ncbi:MAG: AAA-like domain-containing protein [Candidatus Parabeggiatoa sp.]|nr:AAA-like domain-containing protein [Candidatus Parabeggiatoa sp.]
MDYGKIIEFLESFLLPFLGVLTALFIATALYHFSKPRSFKQNTLPNLPDDLKSREQQIIHLADRIRTGQSSAIIGFFSEERRTILGYLRNENPKQQEELYSDKANQLIFSYVDIAMDIDNASSPQQFWELALAPLHLKMTDSEQLDKAYQVCKDNQFNRRSLENLISLVNQQGWRLVLLLDKFEALLEYPHFQENWAFLTTLRSLAASRTPSPLVLIIASNQSLKQFHEKIQHFSPSTSPVLNFIEPGVTTLGALSEKKLDKLLEQDESLLSQNARQVIKQMVGGHPYLLNVAVSEFWKASPSGELEYLEMLEKAFYIRIQNELEDEIKTLSTSTCQAVFAVALQGELINFEKDLKELETQGLIVKTNEQWEIRSHILLKLLVDTQKLCREQ